MKNNEYLNELEELKHRLDWYDSVPNTILILDSLIDLLIRKENEG